MKLNKTLYYDSSGNTLITEQGWIELRKFCESIVYKTVGAKRYTDDLISRALIECAESLPKYDIEKNNELGGWLYWIVRGSITKEACSNKKEIPYDPRQLPIPQSY